MKETFQLDEREKYGNMDKEVEIKVEELNKENRDLSEKIQKQEYIVYDLQRANKELESTNQKLLNIIDNLSRSLIK